MPGVERCVTILDDDDDGSLSVCATQTEVKPQLLSDYNQVFSRITAQIISNAAEATSYTHDLTN